MRAIRLLVFSLLCCIAAAPAFAQDSPVKLSGRLDPADVRAGEMTRAVVELQLEEGWHVYSLTKREGPGPRPTRLSLLEGPALTAAGEAVQPVPHKELDKGFNIEVEYFSHAVALSVPVKVSPGVSGAQKATLEINYQVCKDGACLRPKTEEVPIEFTVEPGEPRADRLAALTTAAPQPSGYEPPTGGSETGATPSTPAAGTTGMGAPVGDDITARIAEARGQGLAAYLLLAVTMGFLALLTPCVFPMVPITVSYFTKQQETNPGSGLKGALAYCGGIVGTFTGLGLLMSVIFRSASAVSDLATNPWINIGLAVLFTVMAFNLFGAFEIIMPSWIVERTSSGSQKGGYVGPILMGLTFSLTSFTCTFGFVGALLATAAGGGSLLWPALGMIAFSTAFASPFFLLALFPGWLAKLPKAGSWMVTVKGYMGFLELAAALKFLSNADLVWQWGFITRPVFLAVWFALFAMAGCYLLGWLNLPHSGGQIGLFRRGLGVATLAVGVVMLAAMNGMPLGQAAGFLPPRVYPGQTETVAEGGIHWSEDYDAAVKQAKAEGKPLFLDFTGVTCTNCRVMEDTIFPRPEVAAELKKFVTVRLYTDKEDAQSQRYADMQAKRFKQTTLPLYVILSPDEKEVGQAPYTPSAPQFVSFLQSGQSQAQQVAENR